MSEYERYIKALAVQKASGAADLKEPSGPTRLMCRKLVGKTADGTVANIDRPECRVLLFTGKWQGPPITEKAIAARLIKTKAGVAPSAAVHPKYGPPKGTPLLTLDRVEPERLDKARRLLAIRAAEGTYAEIAQQFRISKALVKAIKRHQFWGNLV